MIVKMDLPYIKDSINKLSNEDKVSLYNWLRSSIEYDKKIGIILHLQTQLEIEAEKT